MSEGNEPAAGRTDLHAALDFMVAIENRCASETVAREWGRLLLYPELPLVWAVNFARAENAAAFADAGALEEAVLSLPWPDVIRHRKVVVNDDGEGRRFAPGFEERGWEIERLVFMRLAHDAVPATGTVPVREISSAECAGMLPGYLGEIDTTLGREVREQIAASRRVVERATSFRRFASFVDGELASLCELYSDRSGVAQIEDVTTAPRFRGRGLSKAVVGTAVAAARADGADFVFLIADADDWPKEMYRKMGFADIGMTYEFHKGDTAIVETTAGVS